MKKFDIMLLLAVFTISMIIFFSNINTTQCDPKHQEAIDDAERIRLCIAKCAKDGMLKVHCEYDGCWCVDVAFRNIPIWESGTPKSERRKQYETHYDFNR